MEIDEMINSDDYEIFALGIELKKLENGGSISAVELMTYSQNLYQRISYKLSQQLLKDLEKIKNKNNV
jgi:hypothetical protein